MTDFLNYNRSIVSNLSTTPLFSGAYCYLLAHLDRTIP